MREYQRRLSVFESVPGTGSIVSVSVGTVERMQLDPIVWCDCHSLVVTLHFKIFHDRTASKFFYVMFMYACVAVNF